MTEPPVPTLVLPTARTASAEQAAQIQQFALQLDVPGEDINALVDCALRGDKAGARVVSNSRLYLAVTDSENRPVSGRELAKIAIKLLDLEGIDPDEMWAWASPSMPAAELALLLNEVFYGHPSLGAAYVPDSDAVIGAIDLRPALAEARAKVESSAAN